MTIDERLEFLVQSTESLHNSMQEAHASIVELKSLTKSNSEQISELNKLIKQSFSILEDHENRLDNLDS
jgi:peptidoglycan hydrolase CwlO-like protein